MRYVINWTSGEIQMTWTMQEYAYLRQLIENEHDVLHFAMATAEQMPDAGATYQQAENDHEKLLDFFEKLPAIPRDILYPERNN